MYACMHAAEKALRGKMDGITNLIRTCDIQAFMHCT